MRKIDYKKLVRKMQESGLLPREGSAMLNVIRAANRTQKTRFIKPPARARKPAFSESIVYPGNRRDFNESATERVVLKQGRIK